MSGVFRSIDPLMGGEGVGVNRSEDARHCSEMGIICKYFMVGYVKILTLAHKIRMLNKLAVQTIQHFKIGTLPKLM
jgi:hypothetical protein